ncbi:MAG: hypothetical protein RRY65_05605 [Pseudoflavonifractor sp.]
MHLQNEHMSSAQAAPEEVRRYHHIQRRFLGTRDATALVGNLIRAHR